jgi:hypothetical protein
MADDIVAFGDQVAVPQKLRSGKADSVMNALMSHDHGADSCRVCEACRAPRLVDDTEVQDLPQNSVNHRPTTALLSSSLIRYPSCLVWTYRPQVDDLRDG